MDRLIKTMAFDDKVRILAVDTTELVNKALFIHKASPVVTAALGRLLTAGTMMGAMMKGDKEKLTLMMKGDGPIEGLVVCANNKAEVKGYAYNKDVDLPLNSKGKLDVGGAIGHTGMLTIIKDIGLKEPYSGSVPFVSGEIAEEFAKYFMESEQTPSVVALGVLVSNTGEVLHAGGYILQLMPNVPDEIITLIEGRVNNIKPITTLLKEEFTLEEIVKAVSGDEELKIVEEIMPKYECDCTKERMEKAVASITTEERQAIIDDMGYIEVKCNFCNNAYRFDG